VRFFRRKVPVVPPLTDDGTLTVLVSCDDPATADSAVINRLVDTGHDPAAGRYVVRYLLRLPDEAAVAEAARLVDEDTWVFRTLAEGVTAVSRQMALSGLELSRERSRMTGLAQRLGGDLIEWQILC
jgi:hypothetical protein